MSALPDVEATVNLLKAILSEPLDLAAEKRRFQDFLQDYAGRARAEQGLNLERRHLNVLVLGMRYRRFDAVVKGRRDAAGLVGLGDWLSRQEGYDKGLCQWVEVVWSRSLGLKEERKLAEVFRDTLRSGGQGPAMVVLPTGCFHMGDLDGDGRDHEWPVRTVTISRPIAMGKYPVTFGEYDRFVDDMSSRSLQILSGKMPESPDDEGWGRGARPVINVSWEEARAYAAWLGEQTGQRYRLPSEAEWEYAARAGTETAYSWGDEIGVNRANGCDSGSKWSGKRTSPVGSFEHNAFGLYDLHGNVWKWVEDCWHRNYEGAPSDGSAWTSGCDIAMHVVRGGSWLYDPRDMRSANRYWEAPSNHDYDIGFRLVQDLNPES